MIKKPEIVFESIDIIKKYQASLLSDTLNYAKNNSNFYSQSIQSNVITNDNCFEIFNKLPFTTKNDLAINNDEFLCVSKNKIADFVTTSGTESDPVTFYLTKNDLNRLAYNEYISMQTIGASSDDVFQLMTTIDKRFMAGLAYYLGVQELDAGMVRVGPGMPMLQWESIERFESTVLIAIPSFIPKLVEYAIQNGIDYKNSTVKKIICIGEPIRNKNLEFNELGNKITSLWDVELYSTYASTEMGAAFTECEHGIGAHLNPELLILEVIDKNGKNVESGEMGEVVITTLQSEAMPLIRFKTGDLCHIYHDKCNCGKNTPRLGPVIGRKQQMIKYKGTTIFPPSIFDTLELISEIDLFQIEVSKNEYGNDNVTILLDDKLNNKSIINKIQSVMKSKLRVSTDIRFLPKLDLQNKVFPDNKRKPEKIVYI